MEDVDGNRFLDFNAGIAVTSTGHCHPKVVEAVQSWYNLSKVDGVQPPGLIAWGSTPQDFLQGKAAMIWHTTGNLTNQLDGVTGGDTGTIGA